MTDDSAAQGNRHTIAAYENYAIDYARSTATAAGRGERRALIELTSVTRPGDRILEIGSGPGWDADWLESIGRRVRRTDATMAFVEFQNARGVKAERVDVVHDELDGPYAAVVALYVFQHIDRTALPAVLNKVSRAVAEGGALLFSIREGAGEFIEPGTASGKYYIALWQKSELNEILTELGLSLRWSASHEDSEGRWLTMLFTRGLSTRGLSTKGLR